MINESIHKKLDDLQFNSNIKNVNFLIISIPSIGYGGQLSMRILGMKLAYMYNRTVIFDDTQNPYLNYYEPISFFSYKDLNLFPKIKLKFYENQNEKVVFLDFNDYWLNFKNRKYIDNWLPEDMKDMCKEYFNGQLAFRFKLLPKHSVFIESTKKRLGFAKPIIGVHIRRGDKKNESAYVPMRIYNHYIIKAIKETGIKKIFVTSDSDEVFSELPSMLGVEFIYDNKEKRYNNANHDFLSENHQLKEQETLTAIKIIELLSECDYIIGQINTHFTTIAPDLSLVKNYNKTKIYFVNRNFRDIYLNNDPNFIFYIFDILRKTGHHVLIYIVRKIKPFVFKNDNIYKKIKKIYYREK